MNEKCRIEALTVVKDATDVYWRVYGVSSGKLVDISHERRCEGFRLKLVADPLSSNDKMASDRNAVDIARLNHIPVIKPRDEWK